MSLKFKNNQLGQVHQVVESVGWFSCSLAESHSLPVTLYLCYYYDFELQGHLGALQKCPPQQQQQQQLGPLLDLTAIAAGKKRIPLA